MLYVRFVPCFAIVIYRSKNQSGINYYILCAHRCIQYGMLVGSTKKLNWSTSLVGVDVHKVTRSEKISGMKPCNCCLNNNSFDIFLISKLEKVF